MMGTESTVTEFPRPATKKSTAPCSLVVIMRPATAEAAITAYPTASTRFLPYRVPSLQRGSP